MNAIPAFPASLSTTDAEVHMGETREIRAGAHI